MEAILAIFFLRSELETFSETMARFVEFIQDKSCDLSSVQLLNIRHGAGDRTV